MSDSNNSSHHPDADRAKSLSHVSSNLRIVSLCTVASRILGLMRDQAMGSLFGAGPLLDAFTVAFRLPNLARVLLGEGALTTAFLPVFVKELNDNGRAVAARTAWAVIVALSMVLSACVIVAELVLWGLSSSFALSPEALLLCRLTALMLPYVVVICVAAQLGAVLNGIGQFFWPALVPVVLNLAWLSSLWWLVPLWHDGETRIQVTALVVLIAGVLQVLFPVPALISLGFGFQRDWRKSLDRVWGIGRTMLPVIAGLSITQLNAVFDSLLAWGFTQPEGGGLMPLPGSPPYPLINGTATALYLGQRLYQFPLGVFGVALGTVLFPLLAAHAQRGEMDRLRNDLSLGIRLVLAIGVPASAGLMLLAHPLSTLLFRYGEFDADDARLTGDMIASYGAGVWAYCGLLILQRGFYAVGDRLAPLKVGLWALILNVVLNLTLIWPLGGRGLALSTATVAGIQCLLMSWLIQYRVGAMNWGEIGKTLAKTLVATVAMSVSCVMLLGAFKEIEGIGGRGVQLGVPLLTAIAVYFLAARLLGLYEPLMLLGFRSIHESEKARA